MLISAIKSFFRIDSVLDKVFLGLFILSAVAMYYSGIAWDCSYKNCGGLSGGAFWFAVNLMLLTNHFVFWVRNESEELSKFYLFRVFCVLLAFVGYLTALFVLIPDFAISQQGAY